MILKAVIQFFASSDSNVLNNVFCSSSATDDLRVPASEKIYSGLYEYHIPTNTWKKKRDDIACGPTEIGGNNPKTLKSRSSHSMLFHPVSFIEDYGNLNRITWFNNTIRIKFHIYIGNSFYKF